jgi:hypothetical protein
VGLLRARSMGPAEATTPPIAGLTAATELSNFTAACSSTRRRALLPLGCAAAVAASAKGVPAAAAGLAAALLAFVTVLRAVRTEISGELNAVCAAGRGSARMARGVPDMLPAETPPSSEKRPGVVKLGTMALFPGSVLPRYTMRRKGTCHHTTALGKRSPFMYVHWCLSSFPESHSVLVLRTLAATAAAIAR